MKLSIPLLMAGMLAGCGIVPGSVPLACTEPDGCDDVVEFSDDEATNASLSGPTDSRLVFAPIVPSPVLVPPIMPSGENGDVFSLLFGSLLLDSLLLDWLLLDSLTPVLTPAQATSLINSETFLERMCLEGDDPDFFCHSRFGR